MLFDLIFTIDNNPLVHPAQQTLSTVQATFSKLNILSDTEVPTDVKSFIEYVTDYRYCTET